MIAVRSIVFVIDDDASVRDAVKTLIRSVGLEVEVFGNVKEFLKKKRPSVPSCLILDIRLPGISGLDFQRQLADAKDSIPIIFITGHGDVPMSVRAMKEGAVEFLTKPFRDQDLLDAIHTALELDEARRNREAEIDKLQARFETLSPRQREVLQLVISGRSNKEIAATLGTSENTVKAQRSQIMERMSVDSLPELVRIADRIGRSPKL